ncbi:MAG: transcriptional regulator [Rhodovulum sulfidophilum]|uniref:Transcriptional regulator n=1 Tax=Rhodovulum sulfidophilum TaxID=35806 RepID=A0A2W5N8D7_RHOSU|nr:MAG: transcriptional regulator [Rhodovulum sulfidophilum]
MRSRREAIGMSTYQLGKLIGVTYSQIQKYEKSENRVGAGRLYEIACHLRVPVRFFFEGLEEEADQDRDDLLLFFSDIRDAPLREAVLGLVREIALREERKAAVARARSFGRKRGLGL